MSCLHVFPFVSFLTSGFCAVARKAERVSGKTRRESFPVGQKKAAVEYAFLNPFHFHCGLKFSLHDRHLPQRKNG
jgi:hypothetical protein